MPSFFPVPPGTWPIRKSSLRFTPWPAGDGFNIPIIGVARAGWTLEKLKQRARKSVEHGADFDVACFAKLSAQLRYVDSDYTDPATFTN